MHAVQQRHQVETDITAKYREQKVKVNVCDFSEVVAYPSRRHYFREDTVAVGSVAAEEQ